MGVPEGVLKRVLVELEIVPPPPGHRPVPWRWAKTLDGQHVVHRHTCYYAHNARPWFWAAERYPDAQSLLRHLPAFVHPCPFCLTPRVPVLNLSSTQEE
jgi:hypothetical protein